MHSWCLHHVVWGTTILDKPIQPCLLATKKQEQIPRTFPSQSPFLWDSRLVTLSFPSTLAFCQMIEWVTETVVALFLHVIFLSFLFD